MLEKISKDFVIDHRTRHVEGLPPFSHSHQFNEIYFLQSGKCHVYIENEKYTLEDGSVLFIPAFKEHTFVYYDTVDVKRTVLYISTEQLNWKKSSLKSIILIIFLPLSQRLIFLKWLFTL